MMDPVTPGGRETYYDSRRLKSSRGGVPTRRVRSPRTVAGTASTIWVVRPYERTSTTTMGPDGTTVR